MPMTGFGELFHLKRHFDEFSTENIQAIFTLMLTAQLDFN